MAEFEYDGRVILEWPSPNGLAESEWSGRVRVMWSNHPGRVTFDRVNFRPSELGRIRVAWPNELLNQNHPGRVRLAGRLHLGRVT